MHSSFEQQRVPLNCLRRTRMSVVERDAGTGARQHGFFPPRCRGFRSLGRSQVLGRGGAKSITIHATINQKSTEEIAPALAASTALAAKYPAHNNQQHIHLGKQLHHQQQNTRANSVSSGLRVKTENPTPQHKFCRKSVLKMTKGNICNDRMSTGSRTTIFWGCRIVESPEHKL